MTWKLHNPKQEDSPPDELSLRCPACGYASVLESVDYLSDVWETEWGLEFDMQLAVAGFGIRRCPRRECHTVIFVVHSAGEVVASFPPEVLHIETSNLPEEVAESLTEAVRNHGVGSYRSAAIMLRRVLELVCHDHNVSGKNLKERLEALGDKVVLPNGFATGLDALRFLGNDGAHLEARTYAQIGDAEIKLAVDVVKLLLRDN